MRIGLLGCGNIGQFLLQSINKDDQLEKGEIVSVYSRNIEKTKQIASEYGATSFEDVDSFLDSDLDLIVEVATIEFIKETAVDILTRKIDLVLSSIGVFGDASFLQEVIDVSDENDTNVYIPSGAIGGLDILKSAKAVGNLESVQVITRKPPAALGMEKKITEEEETFSGSAADAIKLFPRNMNIAIAVSLAGLGADETEVKVIADPTIHKNQHTISADGSFGEFTIEIINDAMPSNPKTSYLAALSVLASIQHKDNSLKIG